MATRMYPSGKTAIMSGEIDLTSSVTGAEIYAALVSSDYTYSAAHVYWSEVVANLIDTAVALTGKTVTGGVFDADNVTFSAVSALSGDTVGAVILLEYTGNNATSKLIAFIDNLAGLPYTPVGNDVIVAWDNGANKIFALTDV